jgi:hypothetical protein
VLDRRNRRSLDAFWCHDGVAVPRGRSFARFRVDLVSCVAVSGRCGSFRMSSGHLVGRRIQPRFNLVVVLSWHGDEDLGALVDVSVDRTRSD